MGGPRAMIAILAHGRPTGEQRPHGSEMISAGIVSRVVGRKNPHAPVSLLIGSSKFCNHASSLISIELLKPHGHGSQNARRIEAVVMGIEVVSVDFIFRRPEGFIQPRFLPLEGLLEITGYVFFAHKMSEVRKRPCGFQSERSLVDFGSHGIERPSFNPASAHT